MEFMNKLENSVVILTGGTSGFGYEIVKYLLAEKCKVAVFSIDELTSEKSTELKNIGSGKFKYFTMDLLKKDSAERMVKSTVDEYGHIDHVIVNAGFAIRFEEPLLKMSMDQIEDSMRTQFEIFPISLTKLAVAAARIMVGQYDQTDYMENGHPEKTGSIVVVLSEAALCPLRDDLLAYAAAKKASLSVMETLSGILGEYKIRVNGIAPGFANTAGPKKFYDRYPKIKDDILKRTHLKPAFMHPGAIVPAVNYLLTDNYVTGEVIALDGGYHTDMMKYFQG